MMISRIRFINQEIKNKVTFPHKLIDGHFVSHTTVDGKNRYSEFLLSRFILKHFFLNHYFWLY
jgi:hypothetical protein